MCGVETEPVVRLVIGVHGPDHYSSGRDPPPVYLPVIPSVGDPVVGGFAQVERSCTSQTGASASG
jgi:hypothetical protein